VEWGTGFDTDGLLFASMVVLVIGVCGSDTGSCHQMIVLIGISIR